MQPISQLLTTPRSTASYFDTADYYQPHRPARVTLGELDTTHPKVQRAVNAAREWSKLRSEQMAEWKAAQEAAKDQKLPPPPCNVTASMLLVAEPQNDVITGKGCGKTHIARACLWSDCYFVGNTPLSPAGRFFPAQGLIAQMDGGKRFSDFQQVEPGNIVVIDDLGTERNLEYVAAVDQAEQLQNLYFQVFDYAVNHGVSIIVTSNLSITGVADRIGQRAFSRFMAMAPKGLMLDMTGVPDYRRRGSGR